MSGGITASQLRASMVAWENVARGFIRRQLGLTESWTNIEHMELFCVLMQLYDEKNSIHHDLWKEYGWRDSLQHMRSKYMRTQQQVDSGQIKSDIDDAMDLIQYTMFFLRNLVEDNEHGSAWEGDTETADIISKISIRKGDPVFVAQVKEALR